MSVCKDVKIGKILIQTNTNTTEPEVSGYLFSFQNHEWLMFYPFVILSHLDITNSVIKQKMCNC